MLILEFICKLLLSISILSNVYFGWEYCQTEQLMLSDDIEFYFIGSLMLSLVLVCISFKIETLNKKYKD